MMDNKPTFLTIFVPTLAGGVGLYTINLAEGLKAKNYKVTILAVKKTLQDYQSQNQDINLIYLYSQRTLTSIFGLIKYLRKERPNVLLSASYHANIISILAKYIAQVPCKVVITEHIFLSQSLSQVNILKRIILLFLIKLLYRKANSIVAVSEDVKKEIVKIAGISEKKVQVIYNPVISSNLYKLASEEISHPWFELNQPPVIISIGRLDKQKDFLTLVGAFLKIRRKRNARLMIIGEGPERVILERIIKNSGFQNDILLTGFIKNPYPYLKKASVFVLSSRWEGLPTVLIEALALGVPVVSTNCPGGVAEILENGKLGLLVPVGNENKLAEGIIYLLNSQSRLPKIDDEILTKYKLEYAVAEYIKVFNSFNSHSNL